MSIDFSKAPKGATHYSTYPIGAEWYQRRGPGDWYFWMGQWFRSEASGLRLNSLSPIPQPPSIAKQGHPHAALMAEYAKDAMETDKPWERWQYKEAEMIVSKNNPKDEDGFVMCLTHPCWHETNAYRRKVGCITINGHEVPAPLKRAPLVDTWVYLPVLPMYGSDHDQEASYQGFKWYGSRMTAALLDKGVLHLTQQAAIAHAKALLSFTEGC